MMHSQIVTFSSSKTSRRHAIDEATELANNWLMEIHVDEIIDYRIQTIHERPVVFDGECGAEYYTHLITIIYRVHDF